MRERSSPAGTELRAIAETGFRALNSGDLDSFLEVIAEDVEFTSMIAEVDGVTFRGHDGIRRWWETVNRAFDGMRWELLELEEADGRGVAKLRARGELGDMHVEQTVWQAARFEDGKLTWWAFFRSEEEARAAARVATRDTRGA
jgi:ketosteroid isomerase-like protein